MMIRNRVSPEKPFLYAAQKKNDLSRPHAIALLVLKLRGNKYS